MKISEKLRNEAATLLSIAACTQITIRKAAEEWGAGEDASTLARLAFYDDSVRCQSPIWATYAAAEQLLRTGWSP